MLGSLLVAILGLSELAANLKDFVFLRPTISDGGI